MSYIIPTEIIEHIFSYVSLKDIACVNKNYTIPKIKDNLCLTKQQKIHYANNNQLICYNNKYDKHDNEIFKIISNGSCNAYNLNTYEFTSYNDYDVDYKDIDLYSMYNILKVLDIYKENFAKNYILKELHKKILNLYLSTFNSTPDIKSFYMWLLSNLYSFGLIEQINYSFKEIKEIKIDNFILYKQLEIHIQYL